MHPGVCWNTDCFVFVWRFIKSRQKQTSVCVSVLQFVHQMAALFSPLTLHSDITSVRRAADPAHRGLLGNKTHTESSQGSYMSVNRWVFTRCRYLLFVGLSTRRLFGLCEVAALQLLARLELPKLQRPVLTNTITSLRTRLSVRSDLIKHCENLTLLY